MTAAVTIDLAGAQMGGAARYRAELTGYLERRGLPGRQGDRQHPVAERGLAGGP